MTSVAKPGGRGGGIAPSIGLSTKMQNKENTEVGVAQNSSQVAQVAQIAQIAQMRILRCALRLFFQRLLNLRCALCLFFQRLRNLRLRIGKSNICCASIVNFFPRCAITR